MRLEKCKNILLLGISTESQNMGVGALAAGLIRTAVECIPDSSISLLDYCKEEKVIKYIVKGRIIEVPVINIRYSKKVYLNNNIAYLVLLALLLKIIPSKSFKSRIIKKYYPLSKISEADIIGAISGGDSFSDIYGLGRLFYVLLPQLLVIIMGKKLILLPQTIGPFYGWIARILAKYILSHSAMIYMRDMAGVDEIKYLLGKKINHENIKFSYDVAFIVEPYLPKVLKLSNCEIYSLKAPIVGFNISGLLYMGGYTRDNMFNLRINYKELVNKIIEYMIEIKGVTLILIPHVFGYTPNSESDSKVCAEVYDQLKNKYGDKLYSVNGCYNQNEIKYIIGMCEYFIGSRMHACIAAVSQHIPAISIAYSRKYYGVMDTIGMAKYVADMRIMDEEQIIKMIDSAYECRAEINKQLSSKMPEVKTKVLNMFSEIWDELQKQKRKY